MNHDEPHAVDCNGCLWVESCCDASGEPIECEDYVEREGEHE